MKVLLTGMSGTGKSTIVKELAARGYRAVDVDHPEWSEYRLVATPAGDDETDWVWREDRVAELLASDGDDPLFISGCAENQVRFYPQFDRIILLSAPVEVLIERLDTRTNNSYGKHPDELARVLFHQRTVEPLIRRTASAEVDTSAPLDEVIAEVLALAGLDAR